MTDAPSAPTARPPAAPGPPRKILHLLPWLASGGVEQRRWLLVTTLPSDRYEHHIVCIGANAVWRERFGARGVTVSEVATRRRWSPLDVGAVRAVAEIRRSFAPDVIHGAVYEGMTMAAWQGLLGRARGKRGAARPRVVLEETSEPSTRSWRGHALLWLLAHAADLVVGVSPAVTAYLGRTTRLPEARVRLLPNACRPPRTGTPADRAATRRSLGVPDDAFVVGSVGRLYDDHKRFSELIRAWSSHDVPADAHLVVVGGGPDEGALRAMAERSPARSRIVIAGYRPDVDRYYGAMDAFALVSSREAFGLAACEAMHAGLPVIASRVGGLRWVVVDDVTGLHVTPGRPQEIAEAVRRLRSSDELRDRLGAAGRERARTEFSAERYARDLDVLYGELAAARAQP